MSRTHITLADLVDNQACSKQCVLFFATFGDKAKIGPRAAAKAIKAGLDIRWLERLIPAHAWSEYNKAMASAWGEYDKARESRWAKYDKATTFEGPECKKAMASACAEYGKASTYALAEYNKATAHALIKALTTQGES